MFKTIQQKLKDAHILDKEEPILSFIKVVDYQKHQQLFKKILKEELSHVLPSNKSYYLLVTIKITANDSTPTIYLLKFKEKTNDFVLKINWNLNEINSIAKLDDRLKQTTSTGNTVTNNMPTLELTFKNDLNMSNNEANMDEQRKLVWLCENQQDRNDFLETLWKLSDQYLKIKEKPKFINYQFEKDKQLNGNDSKKNDNNEKSKEVTSNEQLELSKSDEDSLLKLMNECDFATTNAEMFIERLQTELVYLDTSNIESIMNSEENTIKLIAMLDGAVGEIEKIDKRLKEYEDKISAVGDAVRIVGERDNVIQQQQNNQHSLLELLDTMMTSLEYPMEYKKLLNDCDLSSSQNVEKCVIAAYYLMDVIETDLPNGLKKMKAYEEQKKTLEHLKIKFCNNCYTHLKNVIGHATNKHLESYKIEDNSLTSLPLHKQMHDELSVYKDLMPLIHRSGCAFNDHDQRKTYFIDIKQNYIETVKQLYLREIVPFCSCARAKIGKQDKPKANASMENLKGSLIRSSEKSSSSGTFSIKIDQKTKETLKLVFIKLLNQLSGAVQSEQTFCQDFFSLKGPKAEDTNSLNSSNQQQQSMSQSVQSESSNGSLSTQNTNNRQQTDNKNDLAILGEIFSDLIEEQVKQTIDIMIRTENMMVIFLYSDLLYRVLVSHNNKQYMHQPLVALLRTGKERCDEFVNQFRESIRDYKVNKKEKIGILKYITYFEEFVKEAEVCWEPIKKDMYEKLCIIYQIIVNEIFKGIEAIANDSQKTPPDVVRFQNYNQMNHIMRSINGLKESTKYARDQYVSWKQSYIKESFGRPLEKLHSFFEKVEAKIERGSKHEDISYQLDLSADVLREIIRGYPVKEVKKGLDTLYNKVEKHLVENSNLMQVVWRDMSNEFISQCKNYENLIKKCYPGHKISLEFTDEQICEFFEQIAQAH